MPLVTGHSMGKTVGKQGGLSYNHSYVQPTQERSSGYGKPKAGKYGRPMPLQQRGGHGSKAAPAAVGGGHGTTSRYKNKLSSKYISPYSQKAQRAARQGA